MFLDILYKTGLSEFGVGLVVGAIGTLIFISQIKLIEFIFLKRKISELKKENATMKNAYEKQINALKAELKEARDDLELELKRLKNKELWKGHGW